MSDDPGANVDRDEDPDADDPTGEDGDPFEIIDEPETGDPFERLEGGDREADPFEQLGGRDQSSTEDTEADPLEAGSDRDAPSGTGVDTDAGPFDASDADTVPGGQPEADTAPDEPERFEVPPADDEDDPFAGLGRDQRTGDPFDGLGADSVGSEDSARPDADLWEALSRSEVEPKTETHGTRRFAEVSKHTYCERCEYFSEPPEVSCAHDGTDILEFVDFETVRVADCPIVAERERLADLGGEE